MLDQSKHGKGAQEARYNTPSAPGNDAVAGASSDKGKSGAGNLPPSSPCDDDEIQLHSDLLNAWTQRFQALTVVTAFLASMDGEMFSLTALNTQIGVTMSTTARELVYACLAGALIFHICATILGYVASFALVRCKVIDASSEDGTKVGGILLSGLAPAQPVQHLSRRIIYEPVRPLHCLMTFLQRPETLRFFPTSCRRSSRSSSLPPLYLLSRCYYTTLCFSAAGFILALTGILAYVWAGLLMPVGIFSTVCLGICAIAGVWAIAI